MTILLSIRLGATATSSGPEAAPAGIVITIEVSLQELRVTGLPLSVTALPLAELPNPEPVIVTWLPTDPVVAETPVITGAGAAAELIDTLSNVAVAKAEVLPLVTANPA